MEQTLDCMRDLMFFFQTVDPEIPAVHYQAIPLPQYQEATILNACLLLKEADFIDGLVEKYIDGNVDFYYQVLCDDGRQFINHIQKENVWEVVKTTLATFPNLSGPLVKMVTHTIANKA